MSMLPFWVSGFIGLRFQAVVFTHRLLSSSFLGITLEDSL